MEKVVAVLHSAHVVYRRTALGHATRDTERVGRDETIGIYASVQDVEKLDRVQWRDNVGIVDRYGQLIVRVP